jgi:uncharacterized alpha-E superfamily protein
VNAGSVNLVPNLESLRAGSEPPADPYANIIWMNVLRSLSAYQMYRQHVLDWGTGEDVVTFLLQNSQLPRSILHCLARLDFCLQSLPDHEKVRLLVTEAQTQVADADIDVLLQGGLFKFIEDLQQKIAEIHTQIAETWFLPAAGDQVQTKPSEGSAQDSWSPS